MPTARATTPATTIRLSDTADVTLTATGPAPLRVELPKELLTPESAVAWQIAPVGAVTLSADGTTWAQTFRLSPFVPGEKVPVAFHPVTVNGTAVTPDPLSFTVETSLRNPTAADARPVTGIEPLPAPPAAGSSLVVAGGSLLVALVTLLAAVLVFARKRKAKPLAPGEWVRERIGSLQSDRRHGRLTDPAFVGRLAEAFREYLTRRFGLNTEQKTTAEVLASAEGMWDADTRGAVTGVLTACDGVKFAGREPTATECDDLAEAVEKLVTGWEPSS